MPSWSEIGPNSVASQTPSRRDAAGGRGIAARRLAGRRRGCLGRCAVRPRRFLESVPRWSQRSWPRHILSVPTVQDTQFVAQTSRIRGGAWCGEFRADWADLALGVGNSRVRCSDLSRIVRVWLDFGGVFRRGGRLLQGLVQMAAVVMSAPLGCGFAVGWGRFYTDECAVGGGALERRRVCAWLRTRHDRGAHRLVSAGERRITVAQRAWPGR